MSQEGKCVAQRCQGTEGDPLCRRSRIREGLDTWWHHAGTVRERERERESEKEREREMSE